MGKSGRGGSVEEIWGSSSYVSGSAVLQWENLILPSTCAPLHQTELYTEWNIAIATNFMMASGNNDLPCYPKCLEQLLHPNIIKTKLLLNRFFSSCVYAMAMLNKEDATNMKARDVTVPDSALTICSFFHSQGSSYSASGLESDSGRVKGIPSRTSSYGTS